MVDHAASVRTARPVDWRQADAMALPFADDAFDAVVCQFGVMFFPDRPVAYAQIRRVLEPGGNFIFNVWDAIEHSELEYVVTEALSRVYPDKPPRFFERTPHGYHDVDRVTRELTTAGFSEVTVETVTLRSVAPSAADAALALCCGTPLRNELAGLEGVSLEEATGVAGSALVERFGSGRIDAKMQAHVIQAS